MKAHTLNIFYRTLDPVVSTLKRLGITPNMVTITSLVLASIGAILLAMGKPMVSLFVLFLAGLCDVVDGHLARATNQQTDAGAFLDSFVDRVSDGVILIGFALVAPTKIVVALVLLSVVASFCVSYARARGQSLGADVSVGPMKRPARYTFLLLLIIAYAFATPLSLGVQTLESGLFIFFVLTSGTALSRVYFTMRQLASP